MALKTFNLNEEVYKKFSEHCKKHGMSMSKKIENFIKSELDKLRIFPSVEQGEKKVKEIKEARNTEHSFKKYC